MSAVIPDHDLKSFSCPHCNAISHQSWFSTLVKKFDKDKTPLRYRADLEEWLKTEDAPKFSPEKVQYVIDTWKKQQSGKIFNDENIEGYKFNKLGNLHLSKC